MPPAFAGTAFGPAQSGIRTVLKIYGPARSRTFRTLWFCTESGIPYEQAPLTINVAGAQVKEDWFLKLNPNGRVPAIDDDGFVMWESPAITLYLARKYKSPLLPATLQGEGRAMQWAFFVANDIEGPMSTLYANRYALPPEKRNAAAADEAEQKMLSKLKIVDDHLAAHGHLGLDRWDLSDYLVVSVLFTLWNTKYDFSRLPKLDAWIKAAVQRPAAIEAIKLRG